MSKLGKKILVAALAVSVAGCAADRSIGLAPEVAVTELDELPPPRADISYFIGPQEKLDIQVVGAETLSGIYLTDVEGQLAFPLIGVIPLEGKTPSEASLAIAERLRGKYLLDPQVRVIPDEFPVPAVSVGGQVKKPGSYPAVGRQTLLKVVNMAEGLTEFAKKDDVLVMRTVAGQRYIGVFNIEAIQRGNYADPQIYPNDIVMVGDSPERRRLDMILQILPPVITSAAILIARR
jgi:polysaccharide export outer membrane protein